MFNPINLISRLIKSSNQKELDRIQKIVNKINIFEDDAKAAFRETYSTEWLVHMDKHSTAENNIVEIMYQSFASGYFAAIAEHYKG